MTTTALAAEATPAAQPSIGIVGAGAIGQALARQLTRAGLDLILSNSRGPDALAGVVAELGPHARAGWAREAAGADIVFVSTNWDGTQAALGGVDWNGRILVDTTNPVLLPGYRLADLGGRNSSQVVSTWAPGARVVKAFNTLISSVLAADPQVHGGRRVVFLSGDDAQAKDTVSALATRLGFAPIDLGSLAIGGMLQQFPGGPLPAQNLVRFD